MGPWGRKSTEWGGLRVYFSGVWSPPGTALPDIQLHYKAWAKPASWLSTGWDKETNGKTASMHLRTNGNSDPRLYYDEASVSSQGKERSSINTVIETTGGKWGKITLDVCLPLSTAHSKLIKCQDRSFRLSLVWQKESWAKWKASEWLRVASACITKMSSSQCI